MKVDTAILRHWEICRGDAYMVDSGCVLQFLLFKKQWHACEGIAFVALSASWHSTKAIFMYHYDVLSCIMNALHTHMCRSGWFKTQSSWCESRMRGTARGTAGIVSCCWKTGRCFYMYVRARLSRALWCHCWKPSSVAFSWQYPRWRSTLQGASHEHPERRLFVTRHVTVDMWGINYWLW